MNILENRSKQGQQDKQVKGRDSEGERGLLIK